MKKKGLISVIVPVYNVEDYLEKCLASIVCQTYTNLEIIIIDDGSTDLSRKIIDEFWTNDSRIRVIRTKNLGVSSARNTGLENSRGDFISFVDSDDWLNCDYYENLVKAINDYNADMVSCNAKVLMNDRFIRYHSCELSFNIAQGSDKYIKFIGQPMALWNKLFVAKYVSNIRFNSDIKYGEDLLFIIQYLKRIDKTVSIPYAGYNYRFDRPGNVVSSTITGKHMTMLISAKEIKKILDVEGNEGEKLSAFCQQYIVKNLYMRCYAEEGFKTSYLYKIQKYMKNNWRYEYRAMGIKERLWFHFLVSCEPILRTYYKIKHKTRGKNHEKD